MAIKVHGATVIDNSKHITVSGAQVDGTLLLPEAGLLQVSKDNGSIGQFGASDTELITIGNSVNSKNIILRSSGFADFKQVNVNQILKVGGDKVQIDPDGSATFASHQFRVETSGETIIDSPAVAAGSALFSCRSALNSGNIVASITADGSATFAGTVDAAGLTVNGSPVSGNVDLSGYDTSAEVDAKIAAIPATDLSGYDTSTEVDAKIAAIPSVDLGGYDTSTQVNAKIANLENALINGAPEALNTLVELSTALGDDANFATTVTNSLAGKLSLTGGTMTGAIQMGSPTGGSNWNQSQVWSNSLTSNGTLQNASSAFDADLSTRAQTSTHSNGLLLTFAPATGVSFTTSLEVYCDQGSEIGPGQTAPTASWNGNSVTPGSGQWVTVYSGSGTIDASTPLIIDTETANQFATLKAVRLDGVLLVDSTFVDPNEGSSPTTIGVDGTAVFSGTVDAAGFTVNGSPLQVSGSQTIISDTAPSTTDNDVGTLWWNSDSSDGSLYVLYQDPSGPAGDAGGKYWIEASPAPDSIGFNGSYTGDSVFNGNVDVTGNVTATYFMGNLSGNLLNSQGQVVVDANNPDFGLPFSGGTMTGAIQMGTATGGSNWNQSQVWSSLVTSPNDANHPRTNFFDGDLTTEGGSGGPGYKITISGLNIQASENSLRVYANTAGLSYGCEINGVVSAVSVQSGKWHVVTHSAQTITSITWYRSDYSAHATGAFAFEINGQLLVDSTVTDPLSGPVPAVIGVDGDATFAGTVNATYFIGDLSGKLLNSQGQVVIDADNPDFGFDGNLTGDLDVTGTGTFASIVSIGDINGAATVGGIELDHRGVVNIRPQSDRTASFATYQTAYNGGGEVYRIKPDGSVALGGSPTTNPNIALNADGSATFAGTHKVVAASGAAGGYRHAHTNAGYYLQDDSGNSPVALYPSGRALLAGGDIDLESDGSASFAGGDLTINNSGNVLCQRSGSSGFVKLTSTGLLKVRGAATASVFTIEDSATSLAKVNVMGDGSATFDGSITTAKSIILPDSSDSTDGRLKFGASTDMMLYHFGGANYFDVANTLNIRGGTGATINIKPKNDEEGIIITPDGSVKLYYDNSGKFETTSAGVSITGAGTFTNTIKSGGPTIIGGTNLGSQIGHEGNAAFCSGSTSSAIRVFKQGTSAATVDILGNGSASFAGGDFEINETGNANGKVNIDSTSDGGNSAWGLYVKNNDSRAGRPTLKLQNVGDANAIEILNAGGTAVTTTITSDGAATFRNTITSGASDRRGQFLGTCPSSVNASIADAFVAQYDGSTVFSVKYTGSASFGSTVDVTNGAGGVKNISMNNTPSGGALYVRDGNGDVSITLNGYDGSADFAGDILCGTDAAVNNDGVKIDSSGIIYALRPSGSTANLFQGGVVGAGTNVQIKADGSASFGAQNLSSAGGSGTAITGDGRMSLQFPSGGGASVEMFSLYSGTSKNISMLSGGSASFAGHVKSTNGNGSAFLGATSGTGLAINNSSNTTVTELNYDGSATFAGTQFAIGNDGTLTLATNAGGSGIIQSTNWSINGAGAGTFGSYVQAGSAALNNGAVIALNASTSPSYYARNYTTTGRLYEGRSHNDSLVFLVENNGKATFGNDVTVSSGRFDSSVGGNSSYLYVGRLGSFVKYHVLGDGSAYFAGNITAGNVSDIKFKENVAAANPQLDDVVALGGILKNWDWKEEAPLNEELKAKRFLGLVAQEAEEICPGIVYDVHRKVKGEELTPETTDEDGNVTPATYEEVDDSYKAINHDILVMKLLGAIAELEAKVAALEAG